MCHWCLWFFGIGVCLFRVSKERSRPPLSEEEEVEQWHDVILLGTTLSAVRALPALHTHT